MDSREVRERFLKYFIDRGHRRVPSSSLIPAEDPTLLFTNAGMNQFKDVLTGREKRDYTRAASAQKCVRAGGKHNDLDNVGYTARHHTFFEMLGNFSFGDYFKKDAIEFAWELIIDRTHGYGLEPARLWFTVFTDDDEASSLWEKVGAPRDRILRFGEKDNFWAMGESGPCGPCSEIHYFRGADLSRNTPELVNGAGDETMEIWNLVFMQYERDASGKLTPLPKPSVDTGAGLERICSILQGVNNNFDTDLFRPIIGRIETLCGAAAHYAGGMATADAPFRVISDHARAATMLVADGVLPSNEGRGYVLRRIIRRAIRYGRQLQMGLEPPFLHKLVSTVIDGFQGIYFQGNLERIKRSISDTLLPEEERFAKTLAIGEERVGEAMALLHRSGKTVVPGRDIFSFYDTFGIPIEVVEEIASDEGLSVDRAGFEMEMAAQRTRSQASAKFEAEDRKVFETLSLPPGHSEFRGFPEHDFCRLNGAKVVGIVAHGRAADTLSGGETGEVITDRTVFYPEGGGQVGDTGMWRWPGGSADVSDTQKPVAGVIAHRLVVTAGELRVGQNVDMEVPEWIRRRTQANHTGTHLLHAALRNVLGESARQMGSLVAPNRLRFDYSARAPLTPKEILEIERQVNEEILKNILVTKEVVAREEADRKGAIAFFGEKYGEKVRVVSVTGFSTELCGGCHVPSTGEIGAFKIVSDKALAAGVRRIEAVTSLGAVELLQRDEDVLDQLSAAAKAPREKLVEAFEKAEERARDLGKEVAALRLKLASAGSSSSDATDTREVAGVSVLTRDAPGLSAADLRSLSDTLRGRLKSGVVAVGSAAEGKTSIVISISPDLSPRLSASDIATRVGAALGGRGGGKRDFAQAGGKDAALLRQGLEAAVSAVKELLSA